MDNTASGNTHKTEGVSEGEGRVVNIKWIFTTLLATWPWFVASLTVAYLIAYLNLRYTTPIYQVGNEILVEDAKNAKRCRTALCTDIPVTRAIWGGLLPDHKFTERQYRTAACPLFLF